MFLPTSQMSTKVTRQEEKIFAEARELAMLRLEQCIADWKLLRPLGRGDRSRVGIAS